MEEVPDEQVKCEGKDRTAAWAALLNAREDIEPGVDLTCQPQYNAMLVVQGLERLDDVGWDPIPREDLPHIDVAEAREGRLDVEADQCN